MTTPTSRPAEPVWPLRLAVAEGVANARSGRWTSVVLLLATAWVVAGVGVSSAVEVGNLVRAEQEWIDAGGYTLVVEPGRQDGTEGIDVLGCSDLADVEGVRGSFAVRTTLSALEPVGVPGNRRTLIEVSPGIHDFFDIAAPTGSAVLATAETVDPLGLADGDRVVLHETSFDGTRSAASAEAQVQVITGPALGADLAGAWLVPGLSTGEATQCYVSSDAAHIDAIRVYASEVLASSDGAPALVRPRLSESSYGIDFSSVYAQRPLIWSPVAGGAILAVLWGLLRWTRRARMAIYATFGAHRRALVVVQVAEWTVLSSVATAWGWAIALTCAVAFAPDLSTTVLQVTGNAVLTWVVASLGAVVVGLLPVGTLLDALKDRT